MSAQKSWQGVIAGAPPVPQVNLLPPEIRASRSLRTLKRLLALVLVLVVALAAAGYVGAMALLRSANADLEAEQAETQRLLAEQRQYSEVPRVLADLDNARTARELGMSTDVEWAPYLLAVTMALPSDAAIESISMQGATPMTLPTVSLNPLHAPSVGVVAFQARTMDLPDTAALIERLEMIDNFQDAYVTVTQITEGTDEGPFEGVVYYEVSGTVQFGEGAYSGRFLAEDEED